MTDECIFCKIVSGDIPAKIVHRDDQVVAFEDIKPAAPVHLLIIPTRHISGVRDLADADLPIVGQLVAAATRLAKEKGIHDQGFRLNINTGPYGGQTVYHLHLHLLGGRFMTWPPG
ncbi:MAG TPA: histidine triad nucleotide-binding protein [Candidatus Dormibacteraeota bacterium]|nr:histidine triad nucleotide-binding protein [Candidatus Dormibacteraeota bacterium]